MTTQQMQTPQQKAVAQRAAQPTLSKVLETYKVQLSKVVPRGTNVDRLFGLAVLETRKNKELLNCTNESLLAFVVRCAQYGLMPGMETIYPIPFKNKKAGITEVQTVIGYKGLMELGRRGGEVTNIEAHIVFENDHFVERRGMNATLEHEPAPYKTRGNPTKAYAIAWLKNSDRPTWVVMDIDEINDKFNKGTNFWRDYPGAMTKKTVVRQLYKWLPQTIELAEALDIDAKAEGEETQWPVTALEPEYYDKLEEKVQDGYDKVEDKKDLDAVAEKMGRDVVFFNQMLESIFGAGGTADTIVAGIGFADEDEFKALDVPERKVIMQKLVAIRNGMKQTEAKNGSSKEQGN